MSLRTHQSGLNQSGNAVVIVLLLLVIVAVGALAYVSTQKSEETPQVAEGTISADTETELVAQSAEDGAEAETPVSKPQIEIKPGNPTVATLNGKEIKRLDVLTFMQTLPPQTRQLPLEKLFPLATNQVINTKIVENKAAKVNLDNNPEVKKQLAQAKKQIVQTVYLQSQITKGLTDERIAKAYDEYVAGFEVAEEVKASHILVDDVALAKEIVTKLIETGDFAALAKEYSKDSTAKNGGDLGYFLKADVVPEFAESAFSMEPGTYTKDPVKTQFGYHIIRVEDKRMREAPKLEQVKPFLEANLRQKILDETIQKWRNDAKIEVFDVNGEAIIEPAAGENIADTDSE